MEYIVFIHKNTDSETDSEQWDTFFNTARQSGLFKGGSAIGERYVVGSKSVTPITDSIEGYMRFDADSFQDLLALLNDHPVVLNGGTVEVCEMPKTS